MNRKLDRKQNKLYIVLKNEKPVTHGLTLREILKRVEFMHKSKQTFVIEGYKIKRVK